MPDVTGISGIASLEAFGGSALTQDDVDLAYTTPRGEVQVVTFDWTSTSGGAARKETRELYGVVDRAVFVPHGTDVPTNNYDVTLSDAHGVDVLEGGAANRSSTVVQEVAPSSLNRAVAGPLTLRVTNAGNAKRGSVYLYLTKRAP